MIKKYTKAHLIKADLIEIDKQLTKNGTSSMHSMILIKHAFIGISNLVDFEKTMRSIYKMHCDLSTDYKLNYQNYEFAKYLRNKFVGHIKDELIIKVIEWRPELGTLLKKDNLMSIINLFILETAINTYVDKNGKHKIFDSETDLIFSHDYTRFINYLGDTIKSSIEYLSKLLVVLEKDIKFMNLKDEKEIMKYTKIASETEFNFIKK